MAGLLRQYGAVNAPKRGRQFIVHRKRPSRGTVGVATSEGAMFGVLFGVAAGILILNMGVLWLGYLASEQRRVPIRLTPKPTKASDGYQTGHGTPPERRSGFPQSLPEFQELFPYDAAYAAYPDRARWPVGFVWPYCGQIALHVSAPYIWGVWALTGQARANEWTSKLRKLRPAAVCGPL